MSIQFFALTWKPGRPISPGIPGGPLGPWRPGRPDGPFLPFLPLTSEQFEGQVSPLSPFSPFWKKETKIIFSTQFDGQLCHQMKQISVLCLFIDPNANPSGPSPCLSLRRFNRNFKYIKRRLFVSSVQSFTIIHLLVWALFKIFAIIRHALQFSPSLVRDFTYLLT